MDHPSSHSQQRKPRVLVVGSINMDLVIRCHQLPQPGQTISAISSTELCGGKGANQAVAAARADGDVTMIGRVGNDAFADRLIASLQAEGIDTRSIKRIDDCSSGVAIVAVEDSGQNSIMVVTGANSQLSPDELTQYRLLIESADIILLQFEIPHPTVAEVIRIAGQAGKKIILDPAPAPTVWPGIFAEHVNKNQDASQHETSVLSLISLICPNETEATALTGVTIDSMEQAECAARVLLGQGVQAVAITLASQGTLLVDTKSSQLVPPFKVQAVDTTAAGDAFAGALAIRWAETNDLREAIKFANAAGALAVTRIGAQQAMPTRADIDSLYSTRN